MQELTAPGLPRELLVRQIKPFSLVIFCMQRAVHRIPVGFVPENKRRIFWSQMIFERATKGEIDDAIQIMEKDNLKDEAGKHGKVNAIKEILRAGIRLDPKEDQMYIRELICRFNSEMSNDAKWKCWKTIFDLMPSSNNFESSWTCKRDIGIRFFVDVQTRGDPLQALALWYSQLSDTSQEDLSLVEALVTIVPQMYFWIPYRIREADEDAKIAGIVVKSEWEDLLRAHIPEKVLRVLDDQVWISV
jgi:hypothetical protein